MGEAQRRKETGGAQVEKLYAVGDYCPTCGKTCAAMDKEHHGKMIALAGGAFIVCWRCGNMFMPQSRIKHFEAQVEGVIVDPNSPIGQAVQQAASKLVLPGGK